MKKLLNKISILFIFSSLILASCSKSFIERDPFGSVPTGEAITDEASMQTALNGAYAALRNLGVYGRDWPVVGDLQADNTFLEVNNSGRYIAQYKYIFTRTDEVYGEMWNAAYTVILRANKIIDADITGDKINALKAQAYAIRALMY